MRLSATLQNSPYVIVVLVACVLLFTIGYLRYASIPSHPMLYVFGGFLLGMLSMSIATHVYACRETAQALNIQTSVTNPGQIADNWFQTSYSRHA
jgi:hypothetical protein